MLEAERCIPRVELLCALEEADNLPSLAYAGIPYQVLGERTGALALMIAWSRSAMARSGSGIAAIAVSTAVSPSSLSIASDESLVEAFNFSKNLLPKHWLGKIDI